MANKTHGVDQIAYFDAVEKVVADEVRFKIKLGIGSDAYTSMRYGKRLQELWDIGGVAATGAGVAASSTVAGTFFATGGWLSAIGLGAAAATPVAWILTAGAASGAAYFGVTRLFRGYGADRVDTIPKFINTPIDILGTTLFDLIAPLSVKIARIDNVYDTRERSVILSYFVSQWGFDTAYVEAALTTIEENTTDETLQDLVSTLADFTKQNPDCNYAHMCAGLIAFLTEIAEADHRLDEREEMAIERVASVLNSKGRITFQSLKSLSSFVRIKE
jgi:uncharacterized tellurite resistance protein B-like protein